MVKSIIQIKGEIESDKWYRPSDIAKNLWIVNSNGRGDYYLVLKLIKNNRLRAKDFGLGKTPYWRLLGSEIIRYVQSLK